MTFWLWMIIIGLLVLIALLLAVIWALLQQPTKYPWASTIPEEDL